jgi:hypothetical protein
MVQSTRRLGAAGFVCCGLVVLALGCSQKTNAPPTVQFKVLPPEAQTPSEIELSDAKVTLVEPTLVRFEVKYRFTKGKPDKYYNCEIFFPGTPNHAAGMRESWELKEEGVLKDGIVLSKPPVKSFEIYMSEAPSPQQAFKKISNVLKGPVE